MHGEQAVCPRRAKVEDLLQDKQDSQGASCHKQADALAFIPAPEDTAKVHGHNQAEHGANRQHRAYVIDLCQTLEQGSSGLRLEIGQQDDVDGANDGADKQIQVESPSPSGLALTEGTSHDRAQNSANAPNETRQTEILGTLCVGGGHRQERQ